VRPFPPALFFALPASGIFSNRSYYTGTFRISKANIFGRLENENRETQFLRVKRAFGGNLHSPPETVAQIRAEQSAGKTVKERVRILYRYLAEEYQLPQRLNSLK